MCTFLNAMYCVINDSTIATYWIQRCWLNNKAVLHNHSQLGAQDQDCTLLPAVNNEIEKNPLQCPISDIAEDATTVSGSCHIRPTVQQLTVCVQDYSQNRVTSPPKQMVLSPRKVRSIQREAMITKIVHVVSSPFPYMVVFLVLSMVVMIFINVMPIAGLVCTSAVLIVGALVLGNLWQGKEVWAEEQTQMSAHTAAAHSLSHQERIESINEFFDALFASIDYSLLMIFLGNFFTKPCNIIANTLVSCL